MRKPFIVNDLALAAALAAIGIPLYKHDDESPPFVKLRTKHGFSYSFFFEETNDDGDQANEFVNAWHDETWIERNPEHGFSYIKAAFKNRESLLDVVNQSAELVIMEKGNKFALISSNASEAIKQKVLSRL